MTEATPLTFMLAQLAIAEREILKAGDPAPTGCWLGSYRNSKGIKYSRVHFGDAAPGEPKTQGLGIFNGPLHREWVAGIARRNRLQEIERRRATLRQWIKKPIAWEKVAAIDVLAESA